MTRTKRGTADAKSLTRQQVLTSLSQIIGLPLTAARRAADMGTLQFGALRAVERGSVGDFALHVQCSWRIEGPDGIVTGRMDLWKPVEEGASLDEGWEEETSKAWRGPCEEQYSSAC